ncbi:MAG: GNAT family N-acetyltransferase [Hyphomicrobiaceae bacterium]|nr:GNAT family N-acetyltransferase [Hyphomicrobiaceae bacterium]
MSNIHVRRLSADDAESYRALRIEALKDAPKAFRDVAAEAEVRPMVYWRELFGGTRTFFGAYDADKMVGQVNFMPETGQVVAHKGWLLGMYVSPLARGTGAGLALIETLLDYALTTPCRQVHLGVGDFNAAAIRLYERAGFERYGTEPRGQIVDGQVIDEHLMVRFLDTTP